MVLPGSGVSGASYLYTAMADVEFSAGCIHVNIFILHIKVNVRLERKLVLMLLLII